MRRPTVLAAAACLAAVAVVGPSGQAGAIPPPQNFAANPGFQTALYAPRLAPWSCGPGTASVRPAPDLIPSLRGTPTATSTAECSQTVPVQPGGTYDLLADVRGGEAALGSEYGEVWAVPSEQWTRVRIRFTVAPEVSTVRIFLHGRAGGAVYWADNVFLTGPESRVRAPVAPRGLAALERTSNSVRLTWIESPGATIYRVYRDGVLLTPYTLLPTLVVRDLAPGTSHVYTVRAVNQAGESEPSRPLTASTRPAHRNRPPAPRSLAATLRPPAIGVFLTWRTPPRTTDGFHVYRNGTRIAVVYEPAFRDAIIPTGTTYTYEITALNSAGESPRSTPAIITH